MQKNTKIEDPLPHFLTTPCTPSKEFENDCASECRYTYLILAQPFHACQHCCIEGSVERIQFETLNMMPK